MIYRGDSVPTQLTVLRVLIYGQVWCAAVTVAFCAGVANGVIQFSLHHRSVLLWLAWAVWVSANLATIGATIGFFFGGPLGLLLVCTRTITWRQRLAAVALEGVVLWATHLALEPWCL